MFIFLVVLVTLGIVIEILSLKNTIAHIDYRCIPVKYGCEPGEVFQLRTTITNYGARTIPFLKLIEILPKEIDIQNGITLEKDIGRSLSVSVIYIRGRQKITRTQQATLPRRGLYFLAGCRLMSGDFLGIKENSRDIKQWEEIIIFPKLLKDSKVHQILSEYYGDFSARRLYIEDPVLVNSYRDYTGREPMRSISWIQSAKKDRLMVKEFDHTQELSVTILLDVFLHWSDGIHTEQILLFASQNHCRVHGEKESILPPHHQCQQSQQEYCVCKYSTGRTGGSPFGYDFIHTWAGHKRIL